MGGVGQHGCSDVKYPSWLVKELKSFLKLRFRAGFGATALPNTNVDSVN